MHAGLAGLGKGLLQETDEFPAGAESSRVSVVTAAEDVNEFAEQRLSGYSSRAD